MLYHHGLQLMVLRRVFISALIFIWKVIKTQTRDVLGSLSTTVDCVANWFFSLPPPFPPFMVRLDVIIRLYLYGRRESFEHFIKGGSQ